MGDLALLNGGIYVNAGGTMSYFEPAPPNSQVTLAAPLGSAYFAPLELPAALTMNQVQLFATKSLSAQITVSTSGATQTATASGSWGSTQSLGFYSRQAGASTASFTLFSSTSVSYGVTASYSVSFASKSSETVSQSVTLSWPQGTSSGVTSSLSGTFSTQSSSSAANSLPMTVRAASR